MLNQKAAAAYQGISRNQTTRVFQVFVKGAEVHGSTCPKARPHLVIHIMRFNIVGQKTKRGLAPTRELVGKPFAEGAAQAEAGERAGLEVRAVAMIGD